ncbi:hypothetical protein M1271_01420 [Patescibacteria group bacterium]|nr:hypothetical protein [Patescibacteria group bacterium]
MKNKSLKGQSLIELIIAIALTSAFLPALLTGFIASRNGKAQQEQREEATNLLQETQEAIRVIREGSWSAITTNGTYHPIVSQNTWTLSAGSDVIDGIIRQITISDVLRDTNGNIVTSGGTVDPSTKRIDIVVSWNTPIAASITSTQYLTRYLNNATFIQTTQADFDAGTKNYTITTNTSGGEVTLATVGQGNWCQPQNNIVNTLTLPKQGNAIDAIPGSAYVGTGDGTNSVTFAKVGISDPPQPTPPVATISGTYTSNYKTNAVFSDGNYAYLATDDTSEQVIILDLTQPPPYPKIGWVTISGASAANGIYVDGNILYVTSGIKLYTYDITNKSGAHSSPLGSFPMWFNIGYQPLAEQVVVNNGYAYVSSANTLFGLQKIKISNGGTSFKIVGVSNLTWQQQPQGLSVNSAGTRAYVAFNNGAGYFPKGFFIVDTSTPDPPWWWILPNFYSIKGTFNAGNTDPRGMAVVSGNKALIVGTGGSLQYQVVDISNESNPTLCGGLSIPTGVFGIAPVSEADGDAFSYIITGDAHDQFQIIMGGAGGGGYAINGTFISSTIDPGYTVAFNRFQATISQPSQTTIKIQVASAPPSGGSCLNTNFDYIGQDGTPSSYFTPIGNIISGAIPLLNNAGFINPGECFSYKVYMTSTDMNYTPTLYDISINYSP